MGPINPTLASLFESGSQVLGINLFQDIIDKVSFDFSGM
jgi:hypothetical protein